MENPNFESLTPKITWLAIWTDISIGFLTVLLERDTLSSFAAALSPIICLIQIFAAGILRVSPLVLGERLYTMTWQYPSVSSKLCESCSGAADCSTRQVPESNTHHGPFCQNDLYQDDVRVDLVL